MAESFDQFSKNFIEIFDYYFGMRLKGEEQQLADASRSIALLCLKIMSTNKNDKSQEFFRTTIWPSILNSYSLSRTLLETEKQQQAKEEEAKKNRK